MKIETIQKIIKLQNTLDYGTIVKLYYSLISPTATKEQIEQDLIQQAGGDPRRFLTEGDINSILRGRLYNNAKLRSKVEHDMYAGVWSCAISRACDDEIILTATSDESSRLASTKGLVLALLMHRAGMTGVKKNPPGRPRGSRDSAQRIRTMTKPLGDGTGQDRNVVWRLEQVANKEGPESPVSQLLEEMRDKKFTAAQIARNPTLERVLKKHCLRTVLGVPMPATANQEGRPLTTQEMIASYLTHLETDWEYEYKAQ